MVSCPLCHAPNPADASACRACGASLLIESTDASDVNALPVGTSLHSGAFIIERVIGQGGFGITYKAHESASNREVAVKEFFPFGVAIRIRQDNRVEPSGGLSRNQYGNARQAFLEEAEVLRKFHHPNIVDVFATFEEKNTAYMVMEYLHGQNLLQLIQERRTLPEGEVIPVIESVGHALEVVHGNGLLHRDIKPENILLCNPSRVVLIDFGSARSFAANTTTKLDVLVTPGYAPLEQYSDAARFNAYTDIYALGATLYHALTGQPPAPATDRAAGVEVLAPNMIVPTVSRHISEVTMWALRLSAANRPQTLHEWLLELLATKDSSREAKRRALHDPRYATMRRIIEQIDAPLQSPPQSKHDACLETIRQRLEALNNFSPPTENQCPSCNASTLVHIAPAIGITRCPLCDGAMAQRQFDFNRCPVCRQTALKEYSFGEENLFCPLCHVAPLKKEERKKLLVIDLWLACPNCHAKWNVLSHGNAKLMDAGETSQSAEYVHQVKPLSEWKQMSGRANHVLRCRNCAAQLDAQGDGTTEVRWKLVRFPNDPHGVGKEFGGKTVFRAAWARVAMGLPLGAGNCGCTKCHAEWHFHAPHQTLKLLQSEDKYSELRGQTLPIAVWRFRANGKTSDRAGFICRNCHAEFDDTDGLMKFVRASGVLATRRGQKYSLADWHRLARGLPDSSEQAALRHEQNQLQNSKAQELAGWQAQQTQQRKKLEDELITFAKQSLLDGYLTPRDGSTLASSDDVRWLTQATILRHRSRGGEQWWEDVQQGELMVSKTRIVFFEAPRTEGWGRPLNKLRAATAPTFAGKQILELNFDGLKKPVGFLVGEMRVEVQIESRVLRLLLNAMDLAGWLNTLR